MLFTVVKTMIATGGDERLSKVDGWNRNLLAKVRRETLACFLQMQHEIVQ